MRLTKEARLALDLKYNWHPCSQMKDFESFPPALVKKAKGVFIELEDGRQIIDAISSWWCKSLGHNHPEIQAAVKAQMEAFEHVIFGNTTYASIIELSERLAKLMPNLTRSFYACDGSSAVEIALKMSLHSREIRGEPERNQFLCLENAYHGETALTMSVSDLGLYRKPYESLLIQTHVLKGLPYVSGKEDPLWHDSSSVWPALEAQLEAVQEKLTAIIVEPLLQGAAGMKIYSADALKRLCEYAKSRGIHVIADEILTGFYRTGSRLACDQAGIQPDFLCLGKALTGGFLPLSVTLTSEAMYQNFYDEAESGKAFLHSHTHSGNALAVAAALAATHLMEAEPLLSSLSSRADYLKNHFQTMAQRHGGFTNLRALGMVVAGELTDPSKRAGFYFSQKMMAKGVLMRAIGPHVYWLPPLNINFQEMDVLLERSLNVVS